jgi:hypothetical protein
VVGVRIRLFDPAAHPRFDDLPWATPLADWDHPRLVELPVGLHRHVVRFVEYGGQIYAVKELPQRPAEREYRLLRALNDGGLPVVAAVALVDRRGERTPGIDPDVGADLDGDVEPAIVTRYLNYALPFRHFFSGDPGVDVTSVLVTSLATLLARLHTAGFYWGDCSLSNAMFRRDGPTLSAYALDAETGDLQEGLSDGQRRADVDITVVNIAGGLADLAAAGILPADVDPFEVAPAIEEAYESIWRELHDISEYDADRPDAFEVRLARLHDLGFSVREAVITGSPDDGPLDFRPSEIEEGHARRELFRLTGVAAREQQARRLLQHIDVVRADLTDREGRAVSLDEAAHRWAAEAFDRVLAEVPADLAAKLEHPQLFLEVLDRQRSNGTDLAQLDGLVGAARDLAGLDLTARPAERTIARDR